jgi:hypothetical protein
MFVYLSIRQVQGAQQCYNYQYLDRSYDYHKILFTDILTISTMAWNNMLCHLPEIAEVESTSQAVVPEKETQ